MLWSSKNIWNVCFKRESDTLFLINIENIQYLCNNTSLWCMNFKFKIFMIFSYTLKTYLNFSWVRSQSRIMWIPFATLEFFNSVMTSLENKKDEWPYVIIIFCSFEKCRQNCRMSHAMCSFSICFICGRS